MSSLRPIDFRFVDEMADFVRGRGFVLDFSDPTFSQFIEREIGVDIDDPIYADLGSSKGKRLRCFLGKVDDATAARTLEALWEYRSEWLAHAIQTLRNSVAHDFARTGKKGGVEKLLATYSHAMVGRPIRREYSTDLLRHYDAC